MIQRSQYAARGMVILFKVPMFSSRSELWHQIHKDKQRWTLAVVAKKDFI